MEKILIRFLMIIDTKKCEFNGPFFIAVIYKPFRSVDDVAAPSLHRKILLRNIESFPCCRAANYPITTPKGESLELLLLLLISAAIFILCRFVLPALLHYSL